MIVFFLLKVANADMFSQLQEDYIGTIVKQSQAVERALDNCSLSSEEDCRLDSKTLVRSKSCPPGACNALLADYGLDLFKKCKKGLYKYHYVTSVRGLSSKSSEFLQFTFDQYHYEHQHGGFCEFYLHRYKEIIKKIIHIQTNKKISLSYTQIKRISLYWQVHQFLYQIMTITDVSDTPVNIALKAIEELEVFRIAVIPGVPDTQFPPIKYGHYHSFF